MRAGLDPDHSDCTRLRPGRAMCRARGAARCPGEIMADAFTPARYASLTRTLCIVVLVIMTAALVYAGWIAISNYSRIAV